MTKVRHCLTTFSPPTPTTTTITTAVAAPPTQGPDSPPLPTAASRIYQRPPLQHTASLDPKAPSQSRSQRNGPRRADPNAGGDETDPPNASPAHAGSNLAAPHRSRGAAHPEDDPSWELGPFASTTLYPDDPFGPNDTDGNETMSSRSRAAAAGPQPPKGPPRSLAAELESVCIRSAHSPTPSFPAGLVVQLVTSPGTPPSLSAGPLTSPAGGRPGALSEAPGSPLGRSTTPMLSPADDPTQQGTAQQQQPSSPGTPLQGPPQPSGPLPSRGSLGQLSGNGHLGLSPLAMRASASTSNFANAAPLSPSNSVSQLGPGGFFGGLATGGGGNGALQPPPRASMPGMGRPRALALRAFDAEDPRHLKPVVVTQQSTNGGGEDAFGCGFGPRPYGASYNGGFGAGSGGVAALRLPPIRMPGLERTQEAAMGARSVPGSPAKLRLAGMDGYLNTTLAFGGGGSSGGGTAPQSPTAVVAAGGMFGQGEWPHRRTHKC